MRIKARCRETNEEIVIVKIEYFDKGWECKARYKDGAYYNNYEPFNIRKLKDIKIVK